MMDTNIMPLVPNVPCIREKAQASSIPGSLLPAEMTCVPHPSHLKWPRSHLGSWVDEFTDLGLAFEALSGAIRAADTQFDR